MGQFGQIPIMQVDPKITYLLKGLCRLTWIWPKSIYTQLKPVKSMLGTYRISESSQTSSPQH